MRVLMVEDDQLQVRLYRRTIEDHFDDVVVDHRAELRGALQAVDALSHFTAPDLVLLDLRLPDGEGFEVLERIRSRDDLVDLPVMVWSGSDLDSDIQRAYASGASAYLVKPSDLDGLRAQIRDSIAFWRQVTRAEALPADTGSRER
ncbi:MAG: response regulator [Actinomycetota bacterium]